MADPEGAPETLGGFLRRMLEETEAQAGLAARRCPAPWHATTADGRPNVVDARGNTVATPTGPAAAHVVRWDPARAQAVVAAGWAILAGHGGIGEGVPGLPYTPSCQGCGTRGDGEYWVGDVEDCPIRRALALIWADDPGYRPEWAPGA